MLHRGQRSVGVLPTGYGNADMDSLVQDRPTVEARLEVELAALESDMPGLQARASNVFVLASAWAQRHDAIVAATPAGSLEAVEARLRRIGIRWGMMNGARMTAQFPALPPAAPKNIRR